MNNDISARKLLLQMTLKRLHVNDLFLFNLLREKNGTEFLEGLDWLLAGCKAAQGGTYISFDRKRGLFFVLEWTMQTAEAVQIFRFGIFRPRGVVPLSLGPSRAAPRPQDFARPFFSRGFLSLYARQTKRKRDYS